MVYLIPSKYKELYNAIYLRQFPLIVYGPSGSGKTEMLKRIIKECGMVYRMIDLGIHKINKPLNNKIITIGQMNKFEDINNVK